MFTPASTGSLIAFCAVVAAVAGAVIAGLARAARADSSLSRRRLTLLALAAVLWLGTLIAMTASGWLAESPSPRLMVFFAVSNGGALAFALSPFGRSLAMLPLPLLVGFQAFRLPLELVLHQWAAERVIPETMTWSGQNIDVFAGIACLALAPFASRRAVAWIANGIGIVLLANVMRVALMSAPLPFAWTGVTPPLLVALHVPYMLIVPVCVGGALAGHVVLTRALLRRG